jgi:chitodextrinase
MSFAVTASYRRERGGDTSDLAHAAPIASETRGTIGAAPTNLIATALTRSSIGLTWTNGTADQAEVRIERCRGSNCTNFTQVAALAGTATSFTDNGLAKRTTYRYRVRAHNAAGDSPYSNTASARTKG